MFSNLSKDLVSEIDKKWKFSDGKTYFPEKFSKILIIIKKQ
jgi:hypothetical protein